MEENSTDICLNESMDEIHSFLDMELEALQSIFISELKVTTDEKCTTVSIDLHPSTADKLDEQYVRMTLQLILEEEYPEKIPEIKIRNPRGLSEEKINGIIEDLLAIAESKKGNSMLFEMIDAAKEHLTIGNRPSGECAICLYGFSDTDVFTKTECYHYFHSHCLARYATNFVENSGDYETDAKSKSISNELLCPMCRIPIQFNAFDDDFPPPEESDEDSFVLTDEILELQRKMADLYKKQVEKGGIIDIEAEKNKYLLEISNVPTRLSNEENLEQKTTTDVESSTKSQEDSPDKVDSPVKERRDRYQRDNFQRYDRRGKTRNYNYRQNDNRGHHDNRGHPRYDQRYNRQSYDKPRGNYNRNKFVESNYSRPFRQNEKSDAASDGARDFTAASDSAEKVDVNSSQDVHDNESETSDQPPVDVRPKHNSDSPRYNRNYRQGNSYGNHQRNDYGNYPSRYSGKRTDRSSYHESRNPPSSHRYSSRRNDGYSANNSEEREEKTFEDSDDNQKPNYQSSDYKRDDDYNSRDRYSNMNPQRGGGRGAYNRKDNYNNYSRNRYTDREQYSSERDNYRDRRQQYNRDSKYRDGDDRGHYGNYNKRGSQHYSGSRQGKYSGKSHSEPTNNESSEPTECSQINTHEQPEKTETSSRKHATSTRRENQPLQDVKHFPENQPNKVSEAKTAQEGIGLSAFSNNISDVPQMRSRTLNPPPGFANPLKKVIYGLEGANPPPGFNNKS